MKRTSTIRYLNTENDTVVVAHSVTYAQREPARAKRQPSSLAKNRLRWHIHSKPFCEEQPPASDVATSH